MRNPAFSSTAQRQFSPATERDHPSPKILITQRRPLSGVDNFGAYPCHRHQWQIATEKSGWMARWWNGATPRSMCCHTRCTTVAARSRAFAPTKPTRALRVFFQAKNRRAFFCFVSANAFECAAPVVQRVRQHMDLGVAPFHHRAIHPDFSVAVRH